jgi:transcriptional regulator with XRE-family HTH domain
MGARRLHRHRHRSSVLTTADEWGDDWQLRALCFNAAMQITAVARHLRQTLGTAVRDGRLAVGWSQAAFARRAGVSRAMVAMVEAGNVNVTVDVAGQLLSILGLTIQVRVDAPFVAGRQRDAVHARCLGQTRRRLAADGWLTAGEVEIVEGRSRGWIDVLAFHPATRTLLVIEVKTEIHDLGQIERTLAWYGRAAWSASKRLGWRPRRVERCVLVLATEANDARLFANRVALAASFPVRSADLLLVREGRPLTGAGLALIDPSSRRRDWLFRGRVDGRRSAAPYRDYAAAAGRS